MNCYNTSDDWRVLEKSLKEGKTIVGKSRTLGLIEMRRFGNGYYLGPDFVHEVNFKDRVKTEDIRFILPNR